VGLVGRLQHTTRTVNILFTRFFSTVTTSICIHSTADQLESTVRTALLSLIAIP
jgi:hypothetical protein